MIRLQDISKIYNQGKHNEYAALHQIGLALKLNEMVVFKGPSGSGKTTLLSIIGCISRPTAGRIWLDGRETTSLPERFAAALRRETFGFIFQNYHLIRGLTVLENTMVPAYPSGRSYRHIKERALTLLAQLDLSAKARQAVEHLSGGEQQRAAIARALINDPRIIIADEPTAHLDTELAGRLMTMLSDLKKEGKTVLVASHDPLVYGTASVDRVVPMRDGSIGNAEEIR